MNRWWGYIHVNGQKFVKRYFCQEDMKEANESPFVKAVYGPWECLNKEEAMLFLNQVEICVNNND